MLKSFRQNPLYLYHYHLKSGLLLLLANLILGLTQSLDITELILFLPAIYLMSLPNLRVILGVFFIYSLVCLFRTDFNYLNLIFIPVAAALSLTFSALIHCCSHDSIRPPRFNRFVGELMGLIQLSSLPEWKITHVFHHKFPDHPELDPHPPMNKSFWEFTFGMRNSIGKVFKNLYVQYFGENEETGKNLKKILWSAQFDQLMKVFFWFLVFKPQLFTFVFIFSIAFKMIHFAWFNYSTHRPQESSVEIKNLTQMFYPILNFFTFGLYYHQNHHQAPNLFNPKYLKKDDALKARVSGI